VIPLASQGVQAWDRYAYTNNNPVRYNDPSGHDVGCAGKDASECTQPQPSLPINLTWKSNCSGEQCGILSGSVKVVTEIYQPQPSYNRGPTGQDVAPPGTNKSSGVAIGNFFGVVNDFLGPHSPPRVATIDSTIEYTHENGTLSLDELTVKNNTNSNVGIGVLHLKRYSGEDPIVVTEIEFQLDEFISPGQQEYISIDISLPLDSYGGINLYGLVFSSNYIPFVIPFR